MKTVKQNTTEAQRRLLDKVIIANGLHDNLTFTMLTKKEQKSFHNLRSKALYMYVDANNRVMLNVGRMIMDEDFMRYAGQKKNEIMSVKMDRLKKAREEQSVANLLIRTCGLSAAAKYRGLTIFNAIYSFYNEKENRAKLEESKKAIREERNDLIELSYKLDHTKTYVYSLDNYDYPYEFKK